jgi:hypothetical protein
MKRRQATARAPLLKSISGRAGEHGGVAVPVSLEEPSGRGLMGGNMNEMKGLGRVRNMETRVRRWETEGQVGIVG